MMKVLILIVSIGLLICLSACGATVRQSVKADKPGISGSDRPEYGASLHQHTECIEDTPFGY